ncbi:MAG TPA: HAMP domain-containing sensor histidine kinase [Myxococcales bacterium]|nr:HAMP domain-containing sensor histidine kinase [Myxococcales bacterium]
MASAVDGEETLEAVRRKYADLARKYVYLVDRFDRRVGTDLAIYRLGSFGLRVSAAALALIGNDGIRLTNARFTQLARRLRGPFSPLEPAGGPPYANLRALVLDHSGRLLSRRAATVRLRYRDESSKATILLHLELSATLPGEQVVMAVVEDISDNTDRDRELAATREALFDRERLRVLGELAASIAHDLGNTLRGASFQLAALRENMPPEKRAAVVDAISQRVEIASEAISRLHDFARTGALGVSALRLDRVVAQAAALLDVEFHAGAAPIEVRVDIPELPTVRGSGAELSLLFVNLLRNARDAMPAGGRVSISGRKEKEWVKVTVADQGTGMADDVRARMFEPFFTTKGAAGTGLGLWLAAGTMQRLGGSIRAANRNGRGAVFVLRFPVGDLSLPRRSSGRRRGAARRGPSSPGPRRTRRAPRSAPLT